MYLRNKKGQFRAYTHTLEYLLIGMVCIVSYGNAALHLDTLLQYRFTYVAEAAVHSVETAPAEVEIYQVEVEHDKLHLVDKAISYAKQYGVNPDDMIRIISCETAGTWDPEIQSGHRYKEDNRAWRVWKGDQEQSYGLSQIHIPSHPTITREMAIDPDFALDFMAKHLSQGRAHWWSCK